MTLKLRAAAQIYPLCLIAGLAILNTLYLGQRLVMAIRANGGFRLVNDLPDVFKGFQSRQFFFVVAACLAYMLLLRYLGFYLASFIYLVGVMLWLRVKPLYVAATVVILGVLIYGVFTLFLKVPLPQGVLFG